jgi:hypothetical protein
MAGFGGALRPPEWLRQLSGVAAWPMNTFLPTVLLPEPVAWPQLQRACEQMLGRALDQSAFSKRMLPAWESPSLWAAGAGVVDRTN